MRAEIVATSLLLAGCAADQGTLSRLQDAYGAETAASLSPPLTATVVLGALAANLCVTVPNGSWDPVQSGEAPPLGDAELAALLGDPVVEHVEAGGVTAIGLSGVRLFGADDRRLELTVDTSGAVTIAGDVLDGTGEGSVGGFTLAASPECSAESVLVSGLASFTDDAGMAHDLVVPASTSATTGLVYPGPVAWLPAQGAVNWQGRIHAELRNFNTDDAAAIELLDGEAAWSGAVNGVEWSALISATIAP